MNATVLAVAAATLAAVTAYAGGWATVTVKTMPEYLIAGKPAELRLLVRQHGVSPIDGLTVAVRATAPVKLRPGRLETLNRVGWPT